MVHGNATSTLYLSGEVGDAPLCLRHPLSHDCKQLRDSGLGTGEWNNGNETARTFKYRGLLNFHNTDLLRNDSTIISNLHQGILRLQLHDKILSGKKSDNLDT